MQASNLEIIKLNNLKLSAKIISEQLKNGVHLGRRVGTGSEFEQYRYYEPGDDPKRIDWKYFSRSGKYMIKESPSESHLHVRIMLDLSGSMNYEENGIKRLDYAKNLAASIAYLAHRQGDSLSYFTCQDGRVAQKVAPSPKAFQRILYFLEGETAAGTWPVEKQDFPVLKSKQKELVILLSDFLQKENEWIDMVKQMSHPKKEIVLFQILGKQETEFDLKGNLDFHDLESGRKVILNGTAIEKTYNDSISNYLSAFKNDLLLSQVDLIQARLEDSIASILNKFLVNRSLF